MATAAPNTGLSLYFILFSTAVGLLLLAYLRGQRKPKNFPPGPWGFPVLGHLPHLGLEPHKTAASWVKKWGPIVGVDFGSFPTVIISDYKIAKEAFAHPAFHGRPKFPVFSRRSGGHPEGLGFSTGQTWVEQRGFAVRKLRGLGFGRRSVESAIIEQALELIEGLRADVEDGRPVSTQRRFNIALWNTTWALIAGKPFRQSDPVINRFTQLVVDGLSQVNIFSMLSMLVPWFARTFPYWITRDNHLNEIFVDSVEMLQPYIDRHLREHEEGQPRDFIDAYLDEMKKADSGASFKGERGRWGLVCTLLDLFVAGIGTTGTALSWTCLFLASYPSIQNRVLEEVRTVLGITGSSSRRLPSLDDRPRMPYTEAVLHEVLRYRTLAPFGVFHSTTESVHFHGFDIPEDTMVYVNLWEAHNNREIWGDPENFRPERWLDEFGEFKRHEGFIPFSTGKRVCIGIYCPGDGGRPTTEPGTESGWEHSGAKGTQTCIQFKT